LSKNTLLESHAGTISKFVKPKEVFWWHSGKSESNREPLEIRELKNKTYSCGWRISRFNRKRW